MHSLPNLQLPCPYAKQGLSSLELPPSSLEGVPASLRDAITFDLCSSWSAMREIAIVALLAFVVGIQDIAGDRGGVLWA